MSAPPTMELRLDSPRVLDLCCGAGGGARGFQRAGWHVTGVDIAAQPNYAGDDFVQGDALKYLAAHGGEFDAVTAHPPCQAGSGPTLGTNAKRNAASGREHPRLIAPMRAALIELGLPFVLENVQKWSSVGPELGVRPDLMLCGDMFPGLAVIRHRWFEVHGFTVDQPKHTKHRGRVAGFRHGEWFEGPYFAVYGDGGGKGSVAQWQAAMGIDWTSDRHEIAEAIPPAYGEHIGRALLASVKASSGVAA